jgi:hypothetical protein
MGRDVLSYGEINRMRYTENVKAIYASRQRAGNWAQWVKDNHEQAAMLNEAERLYNGE